MCAHEPIVSPGGWALGMGPGQADRSGWVLREQSMLRTLVHCPGPVEGPGGMGR